MKRTILALMFMVSLTACVAASVTEVARRIAPSVVEIYVQPTNSAQFISLGTGWLYGSQGLVVTADHVIQEEAKPTTTEQKTAQGSPQAAATKPYGRIKVRFSDNQFVDVVSVKTSASVDLALLTLDAKQIKGKKRPLLELAPADPVIGDIVLGLGYPLSYPGPVFFMGYVNQELKPLYTGMTATICPGHSGSAVVNINGKVVGLALWIDRRSESMNFFLSRSVLMKELKALMSH